jgi:hypothetical protein
MMSAKLAGVINGTDRVRKIQPTRTDAGQLVSINGDGVALACPFRHSIDSLTSFRSAGSKQSEPSSLLVS